MIADLIALFFTVVFPIFETLGIATAFHAIMNGRTSQGSIAWAIALVTFPYLALRLYWVFERNKIHGYVKTLGQGHLEHGQQMDEVVCSLREISAEQTAALPSPLSVYEKMAGFPFATGNRVTLLVDGEATINTFNNMAI